MLYEKVIRIGSFNGKKFSAENGFERSYKVV